MGPQKDIQEVYKEIEAMMIIHNICIVWKDKPEQILAFNPNDDWKDDLAERDEINGDLRLEMIDAGKANAPVQNEWLREMGCQKWDGIFSQLHPG